MLKKIDEDRKIIVKKIINEKIKRRVSDHKIKQLINNKILQRLDSFKNKNNKYSSETKDEEIN